MEGTIIITKLHETKWRSTPKGVERCPFCGCNSFSFVCREFTKRSKITTSYRVMCNTCSGVGPECIDTESAKRGWNMRKAKDKEA